MNDLKRQILFDMLVTPTTCGLQAVGFSLLIVSWALGSSAILPFLGLVSILFSCLVAGTKFVLNYDKIGVEALKKLQAQIALTRDKELNELDEKLIRDRDPRDQTYLRNLRALYEAFQEDLRAGNISEYVPVETVRQIDKLFNACIRSLEYAFQLWENSRKMAGDSRDKLLEERDRVIDEVGKSVTTFSETINEVRTLSFQSKHEDLAKLRAQLEDGIEIARRTEKRVQDLEKGFDSDLREYLNPQ